MWRVSPLGLSGAAAGMLFLVGLGEGSWPSGWCGYLVCRGYIHASEPRAPPEARPFVDTEATGTRNVGLGSPKCPSSAGRTQRSLEHVSLPPDLDPLRGEGDDLFACLLVESDGAVRSAYLIGRLETPSMRRRLVETMVDEWRFAAAYQPEPPSWHRVRLTRRPTW